jgi:glycosyltransferase involved in cell wall biosynthesis
VLSILIPLYNYNASALVLKLHSLASVEGIPFEIICIDDASSQIYSQNAELSTLSNVTYQRLDKNIGRSALRNLLAQQAQYPYLLFIDTDMAVLFDDYLQQYLQHANEYDLIYGGIVYEPDLKNATHALRWKYGQYREQIPYYERKNNPYFTVKTCNLFIKREVFNSIKFNENIREYGHEDTLFSVEIARRKLTVLHVHSPLFHLGLEDADTYLCKVETACQSLYFIAKNYLSEEEKYHIRLLYFYTRIQKMGLLWLLKFMYKFFEKSILKNLHSNNPSLTFLDLYKVMAYDKVVKAQRD